MRFAACIIGLCFSCDAERQEPHHPEKIAAKETACDYGPMVAINVKNEMSDSFVLTRLVVAVDDVETDCSVPVQHTFAPGPHTARVSANFSGNGSGVYEYLKGYSFEVTSKHIFDVDASKAAHLVVRLYEVGDAHTTSLKDRPKVGWSDGASEPARVDIGPDD